MVQKQSKRINVGGLSPYKALLTREQFLFYEMGTTAKLMSDGLPKEKIVECIAKENLFQYPTEKSLKRMASSYIRLCIYRGGEQF